MQVNENQEKQYTIVDEGRFDSNPLPTQNYVFKWTIKDLKAKLENPLTRDRMDAKDILIKDSKVEGNEMILAVSFAVTKKEAYYEDPHLRISLLKKSMNCQDVTICWSVTIESHGENWAKQEFKLQKDIVSVTSKNIKHKDYLIVPLLKDCPLYHITLYMEVIWPEKSYIFETRTEKPDLIKGVVVEHMMMNGKYADIKLTCKETEFNCHKVILAAQSPVFDTMFSNGDNLEMRQGVVDIKDMEPKELEAFLKFFYTGKLDDNMKQHAKALLAAADKYDIKNLMVLVEDELAKTMDVNNATDMFFLAHLHNVVNLRKKALRAIITNFDSISKQQQWQDLKSDKCDMVELIEVFNEIGKI